MIFKLLFNTLTISILATSCANIVTPTGGPKDTQPPQVIQAKPPNLSTHFLGNKVTITFDEYVKLDNPSQEIIISPSIQAVPKIEVKGKKLEIDFKEATLNSNTTYTIHFGESLKDVNESNTLYNFKYIFSTGSIVDSLYVSGKVLQAGSQKPAGKILVMLYKEKGDSALLKSKPFYFTKTNTAGVFQFSHISPGRYNIFALKDENFNYIYDLPNEEIAFLDSALTVDTFITGIKLNCFREVQKTALKLLDIDDSKSGFIKFVYSGHVDSLAVLSFADVAPVAVPEYNKTRDTILAWYIRAIDAESLQLVVNNNVIEKISVGNLSPSDDMLKNTMGKFAFDFKDSLIANEGFVSAVLNRPAKAIEWGRVVVQQDSPRAAIKPAMIQFAEGGTRRILLDFPRKAETGYSIILPAGMMIDYFRTVNDTLVWKVRTRSDEDYGSLKLSITGSEGRHYVMQIINTKSESVVKEEQFTGSVSMRFSKIQPGSYDIRIIYDSNANGKWDTGNFQLRLQPEPVYVYPEMVVVRANWEVDAEIKLQ